MAPRTYRDVIDSLPSLQESSSFDAKRELPAPGKGVDLVVDVCAMANQGGTIIYGISEDKPSGIFSETPLHLPGGVERITSAVQSGTSHPPVFEVFPLADDSTDRTQGFLVVIVPPSPDAPHLVEKLGRFYGRGPGGNVILTQPQIDSLYERRQRDRTAFERALKERVATPVRHHEGIIAGLEPAYLHLLIRPRAGPAHLGSPWLDDSNLMRQAVYDAVRSLTFDPRVIQI